MPSTTDKPRSPQSPPPLRTRTPPTQFLSGSVFSPYHGPPPSAILALQDTFRIPSSDASLSSSQTFAARWRARRIRTVTGDAGPSEEDDLVVIPPLGDRVADNGVQRLLERHGIHPPHREAYSDGGETIAAPVGFITGQDFSGPDMEVDELESDCVSSHTPSRAASPAPPLLSPPPPPPLPLPGSGSGTASPARPVYSGRSDVLVSRREQAHPSRSLRTTTRAPSARLGPGVREGRDVEVDIADDPDSELDLAGICFDPSGAFMYVASVNGVAEWSLQGAEKRWWAGSAWA